MWSAMIAVGARNGESGSELWRPWCRVERLREFFVTGRSGAEAEMLGALCSIEEKVQGTSTGQKSNLTYTYHWAEVRRRKPYYQFYLRLSTKYLTPLNQTIP